jgi:hypothetical protein
MSYSRRYSETVSKTVTVSYPSSQNGGSKSVTVSIPVDVNIHVDTIPFDSSIISCNNNIDLLTTSVIATEAAEIESRWRNSKKIAKSVVNGFFNFTRSEISQQVSELTTRVDATLIHLSELSKSVLDKKRQMEVDFNRISSRYVKVFEDLDKELSNRIFEIDKQVYQFSKNTLNATKSFFEGTLANTITITNKETTSLQSKIYAASSKKSAYDTIISAKKFLIEQNDLNNTLKKNIYNDSNSGKIYLPVCYFEYQAIENKKIESKIFVQKSMNFGDVSILKNQIQENKTNWKKISGDNAKSINIFINEQLNKHYNGSDSKTSRIINLIQKLTLDEDYMILK